MALVLQLPTSVLQTTGPVAEGRGYSNPDGRGNPTAYALLAAAWAGSAAFLAAAPQKAAEFVFLADSQPAVQEPLFRILALGLLAAATVNWVEKGAAENGDLDETIHRRANGSLSFLAPANLSLTTLSFLTNPILNPAAALVVGTLSAAQWWVAGRNYAKYSPEGANPSKILKSFISDFTDLREVDGLNSTIYAALTASFVVAGFAYLFAPEPTLTAIFGDADPKTASDVFLWQLIGSGIATVVGPMAFTQKEAAIQNNFSVPAKRTLMAGLAAASAGHVAVLAPLLGTERAGPLLFPLGFVWGVSAVASALIAIKPKE
ncbi:hypothetical protein WJX72_003826 [[Myrmecia] bisecta]|uniref:Uncharacterized protein n=1 Tax=[Myrmecia] bisecta TaxID=41462 RepID=A0AAW1QER4_9CHLO